MTMHSTFRPLLFTSLLLTFAVSCGNTTTSAHGELVVSDADWHAQLEGKITPARDASALVAGCPGKISTRPDYTVRVSSPTGTMMSARSAFGPIGLVVARVGGDPSVACETDQGSGHHPSLELKPGRYEVYVSSLAATPTPVRYAVSLGNEQAAAGAKERIIVTVTSNPLGAEIRTPNGQTFGKTPAIFTIERRASDVSAIEVLGVVDGRELGRASGIPAGGQLALHIGAVAAAVAIAAPDAGAPVPVLPPMQDYVREGEVAIRDQSTVSADLEIPDACTIIAARAQVRIRHGYVGDLQVRLRGPSGTVVTLQNYEGAQRRALARLVDSNGVLRPFVGTSAQGTWTLVVRDAQEGERGVVEHFSVSVACAESSASAVDAGAPAPGAS